VDEHDRQLPARPRTVVGDAVRRIRSQSPPRHRSTPTNDTHGVPPSQQDFPRQPDPRPFGRPRLHFA
jgi:hypothetical protein